MEQILKNEFGFEHVSVKKLEGYDNANYQIESDKGMFIFKTYPQNNEIRALVNAEIETLLSLGIGGGDKFPRPIQFGDETYVKDISIEGEENICRMLSFLSGKFLGDTEHTKSLFYSLGKFLALMDQNLQSCQNNAIKARKWEWDLQFLSLNKKFIDDIPSEKDRNLVRYYFLQFEENVVPVLPDLRKAIIHNDANEWNILVKDGKVSGIIDFGDMAYTALINELAIAITYACYDKKDLLEWAAIILESYNSVLPIQEVELSVLYYLIAGRLCTSVCNSANSKKNNPDNEYITVSEKPAWEMLRRWIEINPVHAENTFRKSLGFSGLAARNLEDLVKERKMTISTSLSLSYTRPINMVGSAFQYMYDADGKTFLDAYNNIPHVGHCHPRVVEAGQKQMAKLNTNTRYLYDILNEYSWKLLSKFPDSLDRVFFVNSGSEASDLAIRMARIHTGNQSIMVMEHGYHGHTQTGIDISDYKFSSTGGEGQKEYILKTRLPDTYKGKYREDDGNAGELYARDAIKLIRSTDAPLAAFISEPVVGCGGQVPLASGYLKEIYPEIRNQGGVCISDEVQVGFGRLGESFWGYEAHDVVPDIVIIGKPMGNGHPMGAVICTSEIADSFDNGVEFFSSFGGNPVSCAIGLSVLRVIEEEKLQENAKLVGGYYKSLLQELQGEYSCIGDIRGSGLFLGVEFIKNEQRDPDGELAGFIKNELRNLNILIGTDGPDQNVLKTKPPMCFNRENVERVVGTMFEIVKIHSSQNNM